MIKVNRYNGRLPVSDLQRCGGQHKPVNNSFPHTSLGHFKGSFQFITAWIFCLQASFGKQTYRKSKVEFIRTFNFTPQSSFPPSFVSHFTFVSLPLSLLSTPDALMRYSSSFHSFISHTAVSNWPGDIPGMPGHHCFAQCVCVCVHSLNPSC